MNLPNKLTLLRIVLIPVFLWLYLSTVAPHHYFWAFGVFVAASITDKLDGSIARKRGLVTDFGKLMDPLADKLLVMSAMICFIPTGMVGTVVVILILAREFLVTSIRLIAAGNGKVLAADNFGKAKTACQMVWICLGLLWQGCQAAGIGEAVPFGPIFYALTVAVLVLTVGSGANYLWQNRDLLADA